jgi:exopolyphosphatase/guanosine-5'-triphosphate,3'-diphosphate pyrophosphatase
MRSIHPMKTSVRRIAIMDLGSNSARLIVVEYIPGWSFRIIDEVSHRVRLSDGMYQDGMLQPSAVRRAVEAIKMFRALCDANGVKEIVPIATAAVRDAKNRKEFLNQLMQASRLQFQVLSGNEEAELSALGAINGVGIKNGFVMDVGGGSTEISEVRNSHNYQSVTTPLGALRLTELFLSGSPVRPTDIRNINRYISDALTSIPWLQKSPGRRASFFGLGGTLRALVRIDREYQSYPLELMNGYELPLRRIEEMISHMTKLSVSERMQRIRGLQADRADIILAGAMIVVAILKRAGANRIIISGQGVREGVFYRRFLPERTGGVIPCLREFSVLNLTRMYGSKENHTQHVAKLALSLFDQLSDRHRYGSLEREYLWAAAQLHDVGMVIDYYDHHEHSAYIVLHSGLPGYTHRETALIALLCLYHRKGRINLKPYSALFRSDDLIRLKRLTALLRLAEYLDRSRTQAVDGLILSFENRRDVRLHIQSRGGTGAYFEAWEAQRNAELFNESFGCRLEIT